VPAADTGGVQVSISAGVIVLHQPDA